MAVVGASVARAAGRAVVVGLAGRRALAHSDKWGKRSPRFGWRAEHGALRTMTIGADAAATDWIRQDSVAELTDV